VGFECGHWVAAPFSLQYRRKGGELTL
jgi:hypothetical protein